MKTQENLNRATRLFRSKKSIYYSLVFLFLVFAGSFIIQSCNKTDKQENLLEKTDFQQGALLSENTATDAIHREFENLNHYIIENNVNIDSLEFYMNADNYTRINELLGYTETEAAQKLLSLKSIAQQALAEQNLSANDLPEHPAKPSNMVFTMMKNARDNGIFNPETQNGGQVPTTCKEPQYSICITLAFFGGLESAGILGVLGLYICYCDNCVGTIPDKVCGKNGSVQKPTNDK